MKKWVSQQFTIDLKLVAPLRLLCFVHSICTMLLLCLLLSWNVLRIPHQFWCQLLYLLTISRCLVSSLALNALMPCLEPTDRDPPTASNDLSCAHALNAQRSTSYVLSFTYHSGFISEPYEDFLFLRRGITRPSHNPQPGGPGALISAALALDEQSSPTI
jgi:hypothetical protein